MVGGIQVSIIAPSRYLEAFVSQAPPTIHYLAAQHVLRDVAYRRFYLEQAEKGARLIVDNGVFELGQSLPAEDLVRAARLVKASEVILPDVIHDGRETILSTERAARLMHRGLSNVGLCAVVQGSGDRDWLECHEHLASVSYLCSIALPSPKRTGSLAGIAFNRLQATKWLDLYGMVASHLLYRLLGLGDSGHLELQQQRRHPWIRSVDSSAPFVLGALGLSIRPGEPYRKPSFGLERFPSISRTHYPLIRGNIEALRAAAGCTLWIPPSGENG
jgi:hypothetical protein